MTCRLWFKNLQSGQAHHSQKELDRCVGDAHVVGIAVLGQAGYAGLQEPKTECHKAWGLSIMGAHSVDVSFALRNPYGDSNFGCYSCQVFERTRTINERVEK